MNSALDQFSVSYLLAQGAVLLPALHYLTLDVTTCSPGSLKKFRIAMTALSVCLPFLLWGVLLIQSGAPMDNAGPVSVYPAGPPSESGLSSAVPDIPSPVSPFSGSAIRLAATVSASTVMAAILSDLFRLLICLGFCFLLLRLIPEALRFRRLLRLCRRHRISGNTSLCMGGVIQTPFSLWLGNGWIFLPEDLPEDHSEVIVAHERCHIRHRHTLWAGLDLLCSHLFWFNPLTHLLKRRNALFLELECDAEASEEQGPLSYGRTLFDFASRRSADRNSLFVAQGLESVRSLKTRVQFLLSARQGSGDVTGARWFGLMTVAALILAVLAAGCASSSRQERMIRKLTEKYTAMTAVHGEIPVSSLPEFLVRAFLLREDADFYHHNGVDLSAVARAAVNNITGGPIQGASTITQQVAKRFVLEDRALTLKRKLKQFAAAHALEQALTKDRILEIYLNSLYFENGVYGVKAAALHFFGHPVQDISPAEATALAVMVSNPKENNFRKNPRKARMLQDGLLKRMVAEGCLTRTEATRSLQLFWQSVTA